MRDGKWTPCCFTRFQARLGTIQSTKFAGIKWKRMLSKRMNRCLTGFVRLTSFLGLLNWIMLSFKLFRGPAMQNRPFIRQCLILAMWSKGSPSGCYKFPCKIVKRIWSYIIQLKKPLTLQLVICFCSHDLFARLWSENVMRSYILSTFEVFGVTHRYPASHRTTNDWLHSMKMKRNQSFQLTFHQSLVFFVVVQQMVPQRLLKRKKPMQSVAVTCKLYYNLRIKMKEKIKLRQSVKSHSSSKSRLAN